MKRPEQTAWRVHSMDCPCLRCSPHRPPRAIWIATSILAFGGTLAMTIDLSGCTPIVACLLGMMP